ncbi:MAG TPA: polyamine aminopropyltransferase [Thermodesulfatator sp.]|nr:polyamine aminopropyltransferase [Thermodesulfatator sp.]
MTNYWWSEKIAPGYLHSYEVTPLYEERTPHQHLLILKNRFWGRFLVLDGVVQLTEGDEFIYHEMLVHVPLTVVSKEPQSVLIIGGGDGGSLREVLRYPSIERVVQIEVDEAVFRACQKYLREISGDFDDPRVQLIFGDGASYVASEEVKSHPFDVVLVDCTDPVGPAKILFEEDFYRHVREALTPWGVMVQQASLPRTIPHVMPMAYRRTRRVFPQVAIYRAPVPTYGDEIAFVLASKLEADLRRPQRQVSGRYYNPEVHQASFALPTWWQDLLKTPEQEAA